MSSTISKKGLLSDLKESKDSRDILRRIYSRTNMAAQIAANRNKRGWSQDKLGRMISKSDKNQQPVISRMENPDYGQMTLSTMFELADAFDAVFWGEFISFDELCRRVASPETRPLAVPSFDECVASLERWANDDAVNSPNNVPEGGGDTTAVVLQYVRHNSGQGREKFPLPQTYPEYTHKGDPPLSKQAVTPISREKVSVNG